MKQIKFVVTLALLAIMSSCMQANVETVGIDDISAEATLDGDWMHVMDIYSDYQFSFKNGSYDLNIDTENSKVTRSNSATEELNFEGVANYNKEANTIEIENNQISITYTISSITSKELILEAVERGDYPDALKFTRK